MKEIFYYAEVEEDFEKLVSTNAKGQELGMEAISLLDQLAAGEIKGQPLSLLHGIDLRGYNRLYFNNAKHRIIYREIESGTIEVIEVVCIGKRNNFEAYIDASNRIQKHQK